MMSDERFFAQVKSTLHGYAPGVADGVYEGMRRKLWWNNFTKLSASRFNMWYMLLLIAVGGGASAFYFGGSASAERPVASNAPVLMINHGNSVNSTAHEGDAKVCVETAAGKTCCSVSQANSNHTACSQKSQSTASCQEGHTTATADNSNSTGIASNIVSGMEPNENVSTMNPEVVQPIEEVKSKAPLPKYRGTKGLSVKLPKSKETAKE